MKLKHHSLSRRERQIMDIIYSRGETSAAEVAEVLPDPPSYSAVRALLRILEEKGFVKHHEHGPKYVYTPTETRENARRLALKRVLDVFFAGSAANAVAALVDEADRSLSAEELKQIEAIIRKAKSK